MKLHKTRNAFRNIKWGLFSKIINMLLQFILRTVIIRKIGADYLGLNSLFTSVLQILSLTELGFSNAVLYSLYRPLAEDDYLLTGKLLNFYKKTYRIIGFLLLGVGIALMPFLNIFIEGDYPADINIHLVYVVYLGNTAISYFLFAYKKTLLTASQREDINNIANLAVSIIFYSLQIFIVVKFASYYLFLFIIPLFTVFENLVCGFMSKRIFPCYECVDEELDSSEKRNIMSRVSSIFVIKIAQMTRNSFDSIFISAFLGLTQITIYNNYYYILSSVSAFMACFTNSVRAAVGNSVVTKTEEENYKEMKKVFFCYMWISGWFSICIAGLAQPFMRIWVGENLLLDNQCVLLLALYFYVLRIGEIRSLYIESVGLWKESRARACLEMFVNVFLNWLLVRKFEIAGIILATIISVLFISQGYGTSILYKYYFKKEKFIDFLIDNLVFGVITGVALIIVELLFELIRVKSIFYILVIRGLICLVVPNIIFLLFLCKDERFFYLKNLLYGLRKGNE